MPDIPWREKLAGDLVARLAEVIPDGFRIAVFFGARQDPVLELPPVLLRVRR